MRLRHEAMLTRSGDQRCSRIAPFQRRRAALSASTGTGHQQGAAGVVPVQPFAANTSLATTPLGA